MKSHKKYVEEKAMLAYSKYLRGEYFQKARAIILKDDKVVIIEHLINGRQVVPGGGVEEGETLEQAAIREAFEETGMEVKPIMNVGKNFYDVKMSIGSIDFISNRVEHFYLCEYLSEKEGRRGLEGEYNGEVKISFEEIDKLRECNIKDEVIENIKSYLVQKEKE